MAYCVVHDYVPAWGVWSWTHEGFAGGVDASEEPPMMAFGAVAIDGTCQEWATKVYTAAEVDSLLGGGASGFELSVADAGVIAAAAGLLLSVVWAMRLARDVATNRLD